MTSAPVLRPLADLCEAVTVGHVGKTSEYYREEGVPFLRTQNVGKGKLELDDIKFITQEFHDSLKKSQLRCGDVLVTRVVTDEMKCGIVPASLGGANCANVILIRPKPELNPKFLAYLITSPVAQSYLLERRVGSAQQVVNTKVLKDWPIPKLPVDEQKRIVAVLDQAFAALDRARAHAEANLADAQELLDVELVDIFNRVDGNDIHSISSVFTTATGATPPKSNEALYGEDIRFVKPPELLNGVVDETRDGLSEAARPKARLAPAGAVLVSCIGNLGKVGLLDREAAFNQQINAILPNAKIARPDFICWQCRSRPFRDQLEARASGTTIPIVNKKLFNSISVWLPPLGEQDRVSKRLGDAERSVIALRHLYQVKLKDLGTLRQSLLQKTFSGQLT